MALCDKVLRKQCQDLLLRLRLHQSELKVMLPSESFSNLDDCRTENKPEYSRHKLTSVLSSHQENIDERTRVKASCEPVSSGADMKTFPAEDQMSDLQTHVARSTHENSTGTYTNSYTTTPTTRRKRDLINRNVKIGDELNQLQDVESHDRLNFSYSKVTDLHESPEEIFHHAKTSDRRCVSEGVDHALDSMDNEGLRSSWRSRMGVKEEERHVHHKLHNSGNKRSSYLPSSLPNTAFDSDVTYAKQLVAEGNDKALASFSKETMLRPKSILTSNDTSLGNRSKNSTKVSFQNTSHSSSILRRASEKKLLGYDWIAALLDNDRQVMDESEGFFEELREFRRINRDECSNQVYMEGPQTLTEVKESSPVTKALSETRVLPYSVNNRLFTVPIKKNLLSDFEGDAEQEPKQSEQEPTREDPRFVRVSIPRSTLESPHRFKAHRRGSFDPVDSCGLREHCLLGWENSKPTTIPAASSIGISDSTQGISSKMAMSSPTWGQPENIHEFLEAVVMQTLADAEHLAKYHESQPAQHPRDLFPAWRQTYQESVMNLSTANSTRALDAACEGESLRKMTSDLLSSTYSMMFEMERMKKERGDQKSVA